MQPLSCSPAFRRSAVYVLHSPSKGAVGVYLSRSLPVDRAMTARLLNRHLRWQPLAVRHATRIRACSRSSVCMGRAICWTGLLRTLPCRTGATWAGLRHPHCPNRARACAGISCLSSSSLIQRHPCKVVLTGRGRVVPRTLGTRFEGLRSMLRSAEEVSAPRGQSRRPS